MSVPKSIQRMVTVPRGRGMDKMINMRNGLISGILLVSVYAIDFFKLSKIRRPEGKINNLVNSNSMFTEFYSNFTIIHNNFTTGL